MPTILSRKGPCREWPNCECPKCLRHQAKLQNIAYHGQYGSNKVIGVCHYCGGQATSRDHKRPISKGGKNNPENIVPACGPCNQRKGSMDYDEFCKLIGLQQA